MAGITTYAAGNVEDTPTQTKGPWDKVKIKLPRIPGSRNADVFARVNDYTCLVKRGMEVEVPYCVAQVLQNSEEQDNRTAELIEELTQSN